MIKLKKLYSIVFLLLLLTVTACGGGSGDTKGLKESVEQNKYQIVSLLLKSNFTQTLLPVNTPGTDPIFYFTHGDNSEQLTAIGINAQGEEVGVSNVNFAITDDSNISGTVTIDDNGRLNIGSLPVNNPTKQVSVQVSLGSAVGSANIVVSSSNITAVGLTILLDGIDAANTAPDLTVCDSVPVSAKASYDDGSVRMITQKINWPASNLDTNGNSKFDVTNLNKPLFSSHTVGSYTLAITSFDKQNATASLNVVESASLFNNFSITPTSKILPIGTSQIFTLSANINGQLQTALQTKAKWISGDSTTATVDGASGVVTAKLVGSTPVTATCGSIKAIAQITVPDITVSSLTIRDENKNISDLITFNIVNIGETQTKKLTLFALYSDDSVVDISAEAGVSWSIIQAGNGIAINTQTGVVTVTSTVASTATVEATYKNLRDTVKVQVTIN